MRVDVVERFELDPLAWCVADIEVDDWPGLGFWLGFGAGLEMVDFLKSPIMNWCGALVYFDVGLDLDLGLYVEMMDDFGFALIWFCFALVFVRVAVRYFQRGVRGEYGVFSFSFLDASKQANAHFFGCPLFLSVYIYEQREASLYIDIYILGGCLVDRWEYWLAGWNDGRIDGWIYNKAGIYR